jgi:hypothetical protein
MPYVVRGRPIYFKPRGTENRYRKGEGRRGEGEIEKAGGYQGVVLHGVLASGLERQEEGNDRRESEQSSGCVYDWRRVLQTGDHGDDRSEDTHDSVGSSDQSVSCPSMKGGESFGSSRVEYGIHDVL